MTVTTAPTGIESTRMEHRARLLRASEVRADTPDGRRWLLRALPYHRMDAYLTDFDHGALNAHLDSDPPVLTFGHVYTDIRQVLGRMVDYTDGPEALDELFELDDFDAVPTARQASAQLASGTLRRFSVGFERLADVPHPDPDARARGAKRITAGRQLELAIVLDPAVPGTGNLGMRTAGGGVDDFSPPPPGRPALRTVTLADVRRVACEVDAGRLTATQARGWLAGLDARRVEAEADEALSLLSAHTGIVAHRSDPMAGEATRAALAEADEALALAEGR